MAAFRYARRARRTAGSGAAFAGGAAVIPLYGFLEGDTIGLLLLASGEQRVADLARDLEAAASVRVAPGRRLAVVVKGRVVDGESTVAAVGLEPLDRFDVVEAV